MMKRIQVASRSRDSTGQQEKLEISPAVGGSDLDAGPGGHNRALCQGASWRRPASAGSLRQLCPAARPCRCCSAPAVWRGSHVSHRSAEQWARGWLGLEVELWS